MPSLGTLAAFNNAKVPLAVLVFLLVCGEAPDLSRLALEGALLLGALLYLQYLRAQP